MANPAQQAMSGAGSVGKQAFGPPEDLSGACKHVLAEHGGAFALVKRLGMRTEPHASGGRALDAPVEPAPPVAGFPREQGEMAQGYAALKALFETKLLAASATDASDLAEAMAALDAINPSSPEWGPTFFQVSELVEAEARRQERETATQP